MPLFNADALQNTDIEKLQSERSKEKGSCSGLYPVCWKSSSSRKFSLNSIFNFIKGRNDLNNMWSIITYIHVCSVTQWRSCALTLPSLSVSTTLVPCHQGHIVQIHESTAASWGHATSFNSSKPCVHPSQDTGSTNYTLHPTLQEPLVSLWCCNIIPLVGYQSVLSVHLSNLILRQTA